tara:strand:+ start:2335 stop:3147 length:813 start_codon:yes stop_codon:yes gene_type:complete
MLAAFDFGLTNTDVVISKSDENQFHSFPTMEINDEFMSHIFDSINIKVGQVSQIAVTGGKSSDLNDSFYDIPIKKVNEVDAIGSGAIALYDIETRPFVAVSAGTGTACVYFNGKNFNHLGGISVGGGTFQGLLKHLIMTKDENDIEKLAASGDRKQLDLLIGDVVNEIGSLHPEVTASNFAKARNQENLSQNDIAASISNMIGEVIGTISYLNALLCGESEVFFLGRVTLNDVVKSGVEDRLKLANVKGLFKQNREYGNVLGALSYIQTK